MDFFTNFFEILLWTIYIAIWISFVFLVIRFIFDIFRDPELSGAGKFGWTLLLVIFPVIGALIYIFSRGQGMAKRDMEMASAARAAQVEYTQGLMAEAGPAGEIAAAKNLLDSGAISQAEFDKLKAKALA
ncbi:SHOCT domain-containing protein [Demequina sp.]|uniref:SHOCT domain-containing protein n=1 Tax=Demequina sp. TaxID=2050685 RepID=UPI0025FBC22B|nr:SHOCT domain-containing protein [Demequina sp.]